MTGEQALAECVLAGLRMYVKSDRSGSYVVAKLEDETVAFAIGRGEHNVATPSLPPWLPVSRETLRRGVAHYESLHCHD